MSSNKVSSRQERCNEEAIDRIVREFQEGTGRDRAFQKIFDCYYRRVRGYFARRVSDAEVVQDLTQGAFLGLYRGLGKFEHRSRFDSYLFTILRNTFLKHLEAKRRRPAEESLEFETALEISEDVQPFGVAPPVSGEENALYAERRRMVWQAVQGLPDQKRRCVILHYARGLSYQDIAQTLGIRGGTVAATLHQARSRLKEQLGSFYKGEEFLSDEGPPG